jgi:prepilin-type N-terminal cleavage/methylation domain-containing protein
MKVNTKFKFALLRSLNKRSDHQAGFTLIEVIVAIVVLSIFILAAMSALVIGLNGKLKSKLNNEATLLIQQDLEQVRYQATQVGLQVKVNGTPTTTTTTTTTTTLDTTTSSTSTIDLTLTIPISISGTQNYLTTANTSLSIGGETGAYRLTNNQTPVSSLNVTVDLGNVSSLNSTLLANASSGTSITVPTESVSKFIVGDRIVVGPQSGATAIFSDIVTSITGNVITFANTMSSYPVETRVTILPRSGDLITNNDLCKNNTTNIATKFIDAVPNVANSNTPFNGRTYQLTRTATPTSTTRVKVEYKVYDPTISTTSTLAELTTEVIPSVALKCP